MLMELIIFVVVVHILHEDNKKDKPPEPQPDSSAIYRCGFSLSFLGGFAVTTEEISAINTSSLDSLTLCTLSYSIFRYYKM